MPKILVTGGAGFLGGHLVHHLLDEGYSITVMDLLPKSGAARLQDVMGKIDYKWKSLVDVGPSDVSGYDYIAHLSAQADVPLAISSPEYTTTQNLIGSLRLLEAVRNSVSFGHLHNLLFMSSESVYGNNPHVPLTEDQLPAPTNAYAASKVAVEAYAHAYAVQFGIPIVIVRSTTMYGPKSRTDQVVPIFIRQALAGKDITIEGDGSQTRDFNYVENSIRGIEKAFLKGEGIYNIGSGEETSIGELAQEIIRITGSASKIVSKPWRPGEKGLRLSVSIDRAKKELGYNPTYTLEEGLTETVEWFRRGQTK